MNLYQVTIGQRGEPRLAFEVIAPDTWTAFARHADLAEPNERLEIKPVPRESLERAVNERRGAL